MGHFDPDQFGPHRVHPDQITFTLSSLIWINLVAMMFRLHYMDQIDLDVNATIRIKLTGINLALV